MMKITFFLLILSSLFGANEKAPFSEVSYVEENLTAQNFAIAPKELSTEGFELDPMIETPKKSVRWAVALSSIFPGLGHAYLQDVKTAYWQTGGGLFTGGLAFSSNSNIAVPSSLTYSNLGYYSVYSAYRDARIYNRNEGYKYSMPNDSFSSLLSSPFSLSVMKKPEVWGGIVGSLGVATIAAYLFFPDTKASTFGIDNPMVAFPVAIGEESFFRGFLQPMFSEYTNPNTGIYLSSLAFGMAHIPNAFLLHSDERLSYYAFSLPLLTAFGGYVGWLTNKNNSLREAVAIHAWYDFTLFSLSLLAPKAKISKSQYYEFSIPF